MPFNRLTDAQAERLALLSEELGEAQQAVGKILRHGYESRHPDGGPNNRKALQRELGDVKAAINLLTRADDLSPSQILDAMSLKLDRVGRYMHHQAAPEQRKDRHQEGPPLNIRIGEALHLAFRGSPSAVSVRKRLMHPFTVYADHDVENYARDVIIGVLETLLQELPPARIRSLEQRLSDELSEAVECYTHSGNHPAPPHPQPVAAPHTHSDQAAPPCDRPDTSLCTQSQKSPRSDE